MVHMAPTTTPQYPNNVAEVTVNLHRVARASRRTHRNLQMRRQYGFQCAVVRLSDFVRWSSRNARMQAGMFPCIRTGRLETERCPRFQAGMVAGLAVTADIGAMRVDGAGCGAADNAGQGGAAVAVAAHATAFVVDEAARDARQSLVVFQAEARPFPGIGTAGAAALAVERWCGCRGSRRHLRFLRAA